MDHEPELYEKLVHQDDNKSFQLRLVVNTFKERTYVHLRKYFLSYEGEFVASKEGVSMEASLDNILSLLDGLMEIVSHEEARDVVLKHFEEFMDKNQK